MKIAQIAPLMESVPPRLYGGSERIVSYLTDELVRAGHDVTLFASGDSVSSARLVPCVPIALRLDANVRDLFAAVAPCAGDRRKGFVALGEFPVAPLPMDPLGLLPSRSRLDSNANLFVGSSGVDSVFAVGVPFAALKGFSPIRLAALGYVPK